MLPHSKIIVATPDSYRTFRTIGTAPENMRKLALLPFDIDERAISAFLVKALKGLIKLAGIIHGSLLGTIPE
jgi:hypothetical protein